MHILYTCDCSLRTCRNSPWSCLLYINNMLISHNPKKYLFKKAGTFGTPEYHAIVVEVKWMKWGWMVGYEKLNWHSGWSNLCVWETQGFGLGEPTNSDLVTREKVHPKDWQVVSKSLGWCPGFLIIVRVWDLGFSPGPQLPSTRLSYEYWLSWTPPLLRLCLYIGMWDSNSPNTPEFCLSI